jgi:hypothetical protein
MLFSSTNMQSFEMGHEQFGTTVMFRKVHVTRESTVVPGQETRVVKESAILLDGDVEARKQH